jgi:hypothetical protein
VEDDVDGDVHHHGHLPIHANVRKVAKEREQYTQRDQSQRANSGQQALLRENGERAGWNGMVVDSTQQGSQKRESGDKVKTKATCRRRIMWSLVHTGAVATLMSTPECMDVFVCVCVWV